MRLPSVLTRENLSESIRRRNFVRIARSVAVGANGNRQLANAVDVTTVYTFNGRSQLIGGHVPQIGRTDWVLSSDVVSQIVNSSRN